VPKNKGGIMRLTQYHKKRDFAKTSEPKGKVSTKHPRLFVIQKHAARHLHYDFRIEMQGVLKSWAVPKGPSLDPQVKRLAIQVEDHPLEYGSFEGIIPKGQYGGGTVMLWDTGTWESLDLDPYKAYKQGHIRFKLHAKKLNGRWDLIRSKDEKNWFLIKHQDDHARDQKDYDITTALSKSVASQYSIEELAQQYEQIWSHAGAQKVGSKKKVTKPAVKKPVIVLPKNLKKTSFPEFISPQLATLVDKPPEGVDWIHEIKFDGYRILAFKNGSEVILKSRNNKDWTNNLHPIAQAVSQLPFKQIVLDGEVVVLDNEGRSDFQLLQNSLNGENQNPLIYFLFDLLYFEGYDLRDLGLIERKSILKNVLIEAPPQVHYSEHCVSEGKKLYVHSCNHALEGIVSKQSNGKYLSKRSHDWLKVKCLKRQEFVIGGYTAPKGGRSHFGSLFLGVYNKEGSLDFSGNVGTGFNTKTLNDIYQLLLKYERSTNPFNINPPGYSKAHWVQPQLVCEVEFTEWSDDGRLRHPSFKGLRLDKKATEVLPEHETPLEKIKKYKPRSPRKTALFRITHPDKVLYPEDNLTKQDLLIYYETISDYILPYLSLRPLTLVRCPSHYKQCFYQRHHNKTTQKALYPLKDLQNSEREEYLYLNNKEGLLSLVQMSVLEIHPWGSQINHLEQPDIIVLDLDPAPELPWSKVVFAAKEVRDHLAQYQLTSFVKTTGGKGLHVVIPIQPEYDWEEVKEFTHVFVQFLEKIKPKEYISKMTKSKRKGKIFIDYLRNQRTATAIAPYSTRARIHAPVSTPLSWDELSTHKEDNTYTIKTLPKRLAELKEDPWKDFWKTKQSLRLNELK
jgi:bifunctional non-homologous end joining protein LigD